MDQQHNPKVTSGPASNLEKDPDEWVSGDEPMTGAQASYLKTLSEEVKDADPIASPLLPGTARSLPT